MVSRVNQQKFMRPLLRKVPDLVFCCGWVVMKPVRHVLRAIYFQDSRWNKRGKAR